MDTPGFTSLLFDLDPIDQVDELDLELSRYYNQYCNDTRDKSERELHNYLQEKASKSKTDYMEIVSALLYGVLTNPESAQQLFQSISLVNRDQYAMLWNRLFPLATTIKFTNLKQRTKDQMIWLSNELTNLNVSNLEGLYLCLLRQIKGGDFTAPNIRLCDQLLKLLETHRSWLDSYPRVLMTAVYTYLRLIPEHRHIQLATLQQREIRFVVSMLRQKWNLCAGIGRDLIRGLHDVYHLPDFGSLWSDLLDQPHKISPNSQGISNVLKTPTPREFLRSRLTPDMEYKLLYILQQLPIGQYQRNLGWFSQRFLYSSDSEPLYADIIRFIVAGWYPNNQILQSDIVPRYVVIGTLLRGIKSPVVTANVMTALIYDWLFFAPNDNIMFIEPAMLLMERSVERYPSITSSLLEFISHSVNEYYKPMNDYMVASVKHGMQAMLSKTVIRSLMPIYQCPSIDDNTRNIMQILFGGIEDLPSPKTASVDTENPTNVTVDDDLNTAVDNKTVEDTDGDTTMDESPAVTTTTTTTTTVSKEYEDEDGNGLQANDISTDTNIDRLAASDTVAYEHPEQQISNIGHDSGSEYTDSDNDNDNENNESSDTTMQSNQSYWIFGDALNRFKTACDTLLMDQTDMEDEESSVQLIIAKRSLKEILAVFLRMSIPAETLAPSIAKPIVKLAGRLLLKNAFTNYSDDMTETSMITDPTKDPLDMILVAFWNAKEEATSKEKMTNLLGYMTHQCRTGKKHIIGMRWWLFIAGQLKTNDYLMAETSNTWATALCTSYEEFVLQNFDPAIGMEEKDYLGRYLWKDLELVSNYNIESFYKVLPFVYYHLPGASTGNMNLLDLMSQRLLPAQVGELACILQFSLIHVFGDSTDITYLASSFEKCDIYEASVIWQLLSAEVQGSSGLIEHLSNSDFLRPLQDHFRLDMVPYLLSILSNIPPSQSVLQSVVQVSNQKEPHSTARLQFSLVALKAWHHHYPDHLRSVLVNWLDTMLDELEVMTEDSSDTHRTTAHFIHLLRLWWMDSNQSVNKDIYLNDRTLMGKLSKGATTVNQPWPKELTQETKITQTRKKVRKVVSSSDEDSE